MKRLIRVSPVFLLAVMLTACQDASLEKIAKGLNEAAATAGILQTTVIESERIGLMTTDQARNILEGCVKVNEAGREAVAVTRRINALDPSTRTSLLAIVNPVITAVNNLVETGTVNITNPATKQKIQLLLLTLQTTLSAVHLSIAAGG